MIETITEVNHESEREIASTFASTNNARNTGMRATSTILVAESVHWCFLALASVPMLQWSPRPLNESIVALTPKKSENQSDSHTGKSARVK